MEVSRRRGNGGIEENTLAILDSSAYNNKSTTQYLNDDRLAFLEAVRSASIAPENGTPPTNKMLEAIFQILKDGSSLELIMSSFQLLNELDKRFPRVYVSGKDKSESALTSTVQLELVVVEEAWSPFIFGSDFAGSEKEEANRSSAGLLDSSSFHVLVQDLAKLDDETNSAALEPKLLRNMLLLQYLVNVLEGDFLPRNRAYKEQMNWALLRESLLSILLGSRRILYKGFIRDCLYIMSEMSHSRSERSDGVRYQENCKNAISMALPEVEKCTCIAIQKFLSMIMELDMSKKTADMQGLTTRADGVRTPAVEIILDELTYNKEILSPFLQVFDEPKWKMEIIVQYLRKYIAQPSVRTRRSNGGTEDATFSGILKSFSNSNSTKTIIKKISTEVAQLLLAHAFQAYILLSSQHSVEGISDSKEDVSSDSVVEICENMISAFTCLKRADAHTEILPFGKAALFTAATMLSRKSS
ncbi:hypothetical protein LguiA_025151 [Lonicera macranthoides]